MTDKQKDADESSMQGLSVVDSLSTSKIGDTLPLAEDAASKSKEQSVEQAEDEPEAVTNNDECREGCGEELQVDLEEEEAPEIEIGIEPGEVKDHVQNSTLIISTDEHLESDDILKLHDDTIVEKAEKIPATDDPKPEDSKKKPLKVKGKKDDHSYFWVSNITRHVKATDLKKFFAQLGKVLTAKILTNGKSYFGYVSMESPEVAGKCIKQLNNTLFEGKKITVSKDRPDLRETKVSDKMEPKKRKAEKVEGKKLEKATEPKVASAGAKGDAKDKNVADDDSVIVDLRKKLDKSKTEITRYKCKVMEFQRRHDGMRKKCDSLERELKDMQFKMRNERRRLNQDKEQFEKNKKLEQIRFEADRAVVNKELDEVKKLREHLKMKIEEFKAQNKKAAKRRSRSPNIRRSPRGRSPILRSSANAVFRQDDRMEKKRKREEAARGRTPPPPPKLNNGLGKKRGDRNSENSVPNRPYFADVEKRPSSMGHEYDYRHKPYSQQEDVARNLWQTPPYPKDTRRINPGPATGPTYPLDMRYSGGYQFTASNISGPPRSYYPEFGKPYGHY